MSTGRPIVCIAEEDSATGDVAKAAGYPIVARTAEAVYKMLAKCAAQNLAQNKGTDSLIQEKFHCRIGVERSDQAIKKMLGGNQNGRCQRKERTLGR